MAAVVWKTTRRIRCERVDREAELIEERVYPADILPDVGAPYQVHARKCSLGSECNLVGCNCRWAGTNPNYDPFAAHPN